MSEELPTLRIGTTWIDVEVVEEPSVVLTYRGYAPVLTVLVEKSRLRKLLYISASSLARQLEPLRASNGGRFVGLALRLKKQSDEKTSAYVLEKRQ